MHGNKRRDNYYALGSYHDSKSGNNSYKILCCWGYLSDHKGFAIYEINSDSWRVLDATCCDCEIAYWDGGVSLNGKTYWSGWDEKDEQLGIFFLVSFDYTTERFGRLPLPSHCPTDDDHHVLAISVVREENLSVLLQPWNNTLRTEIWVTNKIDETTQVLSWSMFLALDFNPQLDIDNGVSFLVDEEKKLLVCCDKDYVVIGELTKGKNMVYIYCWSGQSSETSGFRIRFKLANFV